MLNRNQLFLMHLWRISASPLRSFLSTRPCFQSTKRSIAHSPAHLSQRPPVLLQGVYSISVASKAKPLRTPRRFPDYLLGSRPLLCKHASDSRLNFSSGCNEGDNKRESSRMSETRSIGFPPIADVRGKQHIIYESTINTNDQAKKWAKNCDDKYKGIQKNDKGRTPNSYLKLMMDDSVMDSLHDLVSQVKHRWDVDKIGSANTTSTTEEASQREQSQYHTQQNDFSQKQQRRQIVPSSLTIKLRSHRSLHMTYFFCGTVLNQMPSNELDRWNSLLREHFNKKKSLTTKCSLKFHSLVVFPPQRQNLIVAVFEASPALNELYEDVCRLALLEKVTNDQGNENSCNNHVAGEECDAKADEDKIDYEFPLLRDIVLKQQKQRKQQHKQNGHRNNYRPGQSQQECYSPWVAHVTLGNIIGGCKSDVIQFSQWLKEAKYKGSIGELGGSSAKNGEDEVAEDNIHSLIDVRGVSLGGPLPQQVNLDWYFLFDKQNGEQIH